MTQIWYNVEVYVDDILVKSVRAKDHMDDLQETFIELRKNIRLNPAKCTFDVTSGKFLGYMLTGRGIEANTEKIQALLDFCEPRNIGDIQKLIGRLAALHRSLSKHAEKAPPCSKILRGV